VLAWSWGASSSVSATSGLTSAGKANLQDLSLTNYIDRSSPVILANLVTGKVIPKAEPEHRAGLDFEVEAVERDDVAESLSDALGEDRGDRSHASPCVGSGSSPEARSTSRRASHSSARAGIRSRRNS
jgi:hypothetical protein